MLLVTADKFKRSLFNQLEKTSQTSPALTIKYFRNQTNTCPSCRFLNGFNSDLFLDSSHVEKKNAIMIGPDKNNPVLTDAWWID